MIGKIFCQSWHTNNCVIIMRLSAGALWWLFLTSEFVPYMEDFEENVNHGNYMRQLAMLLSLFC